MECQFNGAGDAVVFVGLEATGKVALLRGRLCASMAYEVDEIANIKTRATDVRGALTCAGL
jgi:hypothetical protein